MKKVTKLLAILGIALLATTASTVRASEINDSQTVERVGIFMRDLQIYHQDDWRSLTIDLEYEAEADSQAMDAQSVKAHVRRFLEQYSESADFWEIMNTKLARSLLEAFPDLNAMQSKLSLEPDESLHSPRASIVKYGKEESALQESFTFTKLNYLICQETFQSLDLRMTWDMKENPGVWDYPDYLWIEEAMQEFFVEHPVSFSKWESLKPELEAHLLETFSTITAIDVEVISAK